MTRSPENDKVMAAYVAGQCMGMAFRIRSGEPVTADDLDLVAAVLVEHFDIDHVGARAVVDRVRAREPAPGRER